MAPPSGEKTKLDSVHNYKPSSIQRYQNCIEIPTA